MSDTVSVYRERAHLVSFLTTVYPSVGAYNDPLEPEFCIVYVETPVGQMSWYIHPDDMDLFDGMCIVGDAVWDGHSTEDKYRRLSGFTKIRRTMGEASGGVMEPHGPGRKRLDALLGVYDSKYVTVSLGRS